jgi:hypothetical protein
MDRAIFIFYYNERAFLPSQGNWTISDTVIVFSTNTQELLAVNELNTTIAQLDVS